MKYYPSAFLLLIVCGACSKHGPPYTAKEALKTFQIEPGFRIDPYITEPDREKAIRAILAEARPGDIVIIAGKGHETYQVLKDRTIHFDDRETARAILQSMGYGKSQ